MPLATRSPGVGGTRPDSPAEAALPQCNGRLSYFLRNESRAMTSPEPASSAAAAGASAPPAPADGAAAPIALSWTPKLTEGSPKPLIAVLGLIEGGGHAGHIVVHLDREPIYLYSELEDRGWRYARVPAPKGEVRLELRGPS